MNPIGQRIKELLKSNGLTQKSVGAAIGVTQSHMSELTHEQLKKDPAKLNADAFMQLCVELSTTPEYLFYGEGERMSDARSGYEAQLLMLFRAVPEDRKELLLDLLKTAAHSGNDAAA